MEKWIFMATGMIFLFASSAPIYASNNFQPKGHIQNDRGQKCTYTQTTNHESTYFHGTLTGRAGTIDFDDPMCMSESDFGLRINKMLINNIISRWYSHSDAAFKTKAKELYPSSPLQKKGQCIQSGKYPVIGITVDYEIHNSSIVRVRHGSSVQGCTR